MKLNKDDVPQMLERLNNLSKIVKDVEDIQQVKQMIKEALPNIKNKGDVQAAAETIRTMKEKQLIANLEVVDNEQIKELRQMMQKITLNYVPNLEE